MKKHLFLISLLYLQIILQVNSKIHNPFKKVGKAFKSVGNSISKGITSAANTVAKEVTSAANTVASGFTEKIIEPT